MAKLNSVELQHTCSGVFSLLGAELMRAYEKEYDLACDYPPYSKSENLSPMDKSFSLNEAAMKYIVAEPEEYIPLDILRGALNIILSTYCEKMFTGKDAAKRILELKQLQERKKLEKAA